MPKVMGWYTIELSHHLTKTLFSFIMSAVNNPNRSYEQICCSSGLVVSFTGALSSKGNAVWSVVFSIIYLHQTFSQNTGY